MNVGKALYNILSNDAEIVAICGTRVYPEIADQDAALPFIVYKVSDIQPSGTKSGSSSLDTARVDVYCVSEEYGEAMTISDEVRSALDRVGGTYTGVNIQSIDFDTADVEYDSDQRAYIAEATYNVRVLRVGQAPDINIQPLSILTVEEVDGDPSGLVNKLVVSNGALSIDGSTATITTGGAAVQYHGRYDTEAETERSGATATLEVYYTARPDGDGFAESEVSDVGETDTINRTLYYSTKYLADPDTAGDWTEYTTQPADNATFATAKAALLAGLNETDATAETRGTLPLSLKMVRTTTTVTPSQDLLLDLYPGAAAAYSTRKLDKDYTGYCMRVRRSSDDAQTDIGFDSEGNLDTAAIASHCGSSTGFVSIWYSQTGSNDATQSTANQQPQIYNGTAVITENGKPALQFDGTNDYLDKSTTDSVSGFVSLFTVGTSDSLSGGAGTGSGRSLVSLGTTTTNGQRRANIIWNGGSGPTWYYYTSVYGANNQIATATVDAQYLHSSIFDTTGNDSQGAIDGGTLVNLSGTINTMTNYTIRVGTSSANEYWSGHIQEIVAYKTDQTTNRSGIETDISNHYFGQDRMLETYGAAAAAYSVRQLSKYATKCMRIRRNSDDAETDIGFDSNGDLDTASIATHCGSANGYVVTWYDQSGNSNNATQSTTSAQPQIYNGTAVITLNGKPSINPTSGSQYLDFSFAASTAGATGFTVVRSSVTDSKALINGSNVSQYIGVAQDASTSSIIDSQSGNVSYRLNKASFTPADRDAFHDATSTGNHLLCFYTDLTTAFTNHLGYSGAGTVYMFQMQEAVFYRSDEFTSGNLSGIETNISTYFSTP